jgi:hypothetical protein
VSAAQLIDRVNQHGVSFDLTPERRARLKTQKMDDSVLDELARTKKK